MEQPASINFRRQKLVLAQEDIEITAEYELDRDVIHIKLRRQILDRNYELKIEIPQDAMYVTHHGLETPVTYRIPSRPDEEGTWQ